MLRRTYLAILCWWRAGRAFWRCPICQSSRKWDTEHVLDFYPMLSKAKNVPACCLQEFAKWAYAPPDA